MPALEQVNTPTNENTAMNEAIKNISIDVLFNRIYEKYLSQYNLTPEQREAIKELIPHYSEPQSIQTVVETLKSPGCWIKNTIWVTKTIPKGKAKVNFGAKGKLGVGGPELSKQALMKLSEAFGCPVEESVEQVDKGYKLKGAGLFTFTKSAIKETTMENTAELRAEKREQKREEMNLEALASAV